MTYGISFPHSLSSFLCLQGFCLVLVFFLYIYIKKVFHFEEENTEYHKNKNFSQASRKQSLVKILNILYFYKTIIYKVLNESKVNNRILIFKIVFSCPWI